MPTLVLGNSGNRPHRIVEKPGLLLRLAPGVRGQNNLVAGGKALRTVFRLQSHILAKQAALFLRGTGGGVKLVNLAIGVTDNKPALARLGGGVVRPLADKRGVAFLLSFCPMDRALLVKDAKAGFKVALVHRIERLLLRLVFHAINRMKLGGSMFGFQDIEQAAPLDAGKLLIIARANDLCAAPGGVSE